MYSPEHVAGWRRVTEFVHDQSAAKICLQLGHSGGKGSTQIGWETMDCAARSGQLAADRCVRMSAWSERNDAPRQ
jgi:anthraniloyl-CoA monooxygenase